MKSELQELPLLWRHRQLIDSADRTSSDDGLPGGSEGCEDIAQVGPDRVQRVSNCLKMIQGRHFSTDNTPQQRQPDQRIAFPSCRVDHPRHIHWFLKMD